MGFKDNSKPWLEEGDKPTQAQFWQILDWLRWKDENLEIGDVNNLTEILNGLAVPVETFDTNADPYEYTIPQNYLLEKVLLMPTADCNVQIGMFSEAIDSVVPEVEVLQAKPMVVSVDVLAAYSNKKIIISGMPVGSTVKYIRRRIQN